MSIPVSLCCPGVRPDGRPARPPRPCAQLACCLGAAVAQDTGELSGTLRKAKDTGSLIIGYRESSRRSPT